MARLIDALAMTAKPAAAKGLVEILNTLAKGSTQRRRKLQVVREMADKGAR